jgi:hypothetical protein
MKNIADLIIKYFNNRLYEHYFNKLTYKTYNTYLPNVKLKYLLGKICIVVNYFNMNIGEYLPNKNYKIGLHNRITYLDPIIHATTDEPENGWLRNGDYIMRGQSNKDDIKDEFSKFVRVYPYNIIRSKNYDIIPFINNGYSLIAINKTNNDVNTKNYNDFFKISNIIPKYWSFTNNSWIKKRIFIK